MKYLVILLIATTITATIAVYSFERDSKLTIKTGNSSQWFIVSLIFSFVNGCLVYLLVSYLLKTF